MTAPTPTPPDDHVDTDTELAPDTDTDPDIDPGIEPDIEPDIASDADHIPGRDSDIDSDGDAERGAAVDEAPEPPLGVRRLILLYGGWALVGFAAMLFWSGFQLKGHGPGDDFALYTNQARSLVHGDIGRTIADTRFAIDNSAWHSFSPYVYPWGLPVLLAPALAATGTLDSITGIDYGPLKLVISASLLVALACYLRLCRRRIHPVGAALLALFFATNFWFTTHVDQVLSEFPFLMSVMVFVVWLDRLIERKQLLGHQRWPLVVLGLIAMYSFNTRREGLGIVVGLAAAQAAALISEHGWIRRATITEWVERVPWRAVATPWIAFFGSVAAFQLVLPSDLIPRYDERQPGLPMGLHRIDDNLRSYKVLLAEQLGLKDGGAAPVSAFGSQGWGSVALWAVIATTAIGLVVTVATRSRRDAGVVGVFVGIGGLVLVAPFSDYRYLMASMPLLVYFAYVGTTVPIGWIARRRPPATLWVAELALVAFIAGGWPDTINAYRYRTDQHAVQSGPQEQAALEMWSAVRRVTPGDAVIVFNRARTMQLYTGRRAVQGGALDFTATAGDFYVMYLNSDGTPGDYSQYPLTDTEAAELGFVELWRNPGWVIWDIPDRHLGTGTK